MNVLKCKLSCEALDNAWNIVTRFLPSNQAQQTLIVDSNGLFPLWGADARGALNLGPELELYDNAGPGSLGGQRQPYSQDICFADAVWDDATASLYVANERDLLRIQADGSVSVIAGGEARADDHFVGIFDVTSDGSGTLFVIARQPHYSHVYSVKLPSWYASAGHQAAAGPASEAAPAAPDAAAALAGAPLAPIGPVSAVAEAPVVTLLHQEPFRMYYVKFDAGSGADAASLIYASDTAIYRLPLGAGPDGTRAAGDPVTLAGREGLRGVGDGRGEEARFINIAGLALAADGCLCVADAHADSLHVRNVTRDGTVSTVIQGLDIEDVSGLAILPNGYLAACGGKEVLALDLGLVPARTALPPRPPPGPPRRTLSADLGALLDRQPDGTADLEVIVGDRAFPVHRTLLAARCDYFRQRLGGGFADGGAARLSLPDADPEAFALTLRYLYTGAVDFPAALATAVAELADRLLLPDLCLDAQARVLAGVTPESVVGAMLWAESHGAGFSQLLADLKAWYVEHYGEVRQEAGPSLKRLMRENPDLAVSLMDALEERNAKAARIR